MATKGYKKTKWPDKKTGKVVWVCRCCNHVFWTEDVAEAHVAAKRAGGGRPSAPEQPVSTPEPPEEQE